MEVRQKQGSVETNVLGLDPGFLDCTPSDIWVIYLPVKSPPLVKVGIRKINIEPPLS